VPAADPLEQCVGFDGDDANTHKNRERHGVSPEEAEEVFFRAPLMVRSDIRHSETEKRYYALGDTAGRWPAVVYCIHHSAEAHTSDFSQGYEPE